jgi:purine nucleosidase
VRVHLDTDLGTDPDDACALAMLLGWPGAELVGVTTSTDPGGQRAGYAAHCLGLLGRDDVPVAAGAARSLSHDRLAVPVAEPRYWPAPVAPRPAPPGAASDLLRDSIARGATVVAVGPFTNLALLEQAEPGILAAARVVVMGGWARPPAPGLPAWGPERDYNVQWDTRAAEVVATACARLTLCTLTACLHAPLRARDLPRLRGLGPMGALLARQSEAHSVDTGKRDLGRAYEGLPDDLLNFHYDPLACAVALGWPGAAVEETRLRVGMEEGLLRFRPDEDGRPFRVAVGVDGEAFAETWIDAVSAAVAASR